MCISYHENTQTFHLFNGQISYIFKVLKNGQLGHLYYGSFIQDRSSFDHLLELRPRPMAACSFLDDISFSLEHIKQEYPSYGSGDLRHPAFEIIQENGSRISNFQYVRHTIQKGKPKLPGLPATYVEDEREAQTLCITLYDTLIDMELILSYTIYRDYPVITRNSFFKNMGKQKLILNNAMSMSVDLPDANFEMVTLTGAWSRERFVKKRRLHHGLQSVYSMRGCSSSNFNPFLALKRPNTSEDSGEVYGFSFVYSGNFLAQVEVDTYDVSRITMGIHPNTFTWTLEGNECFQTPEVVMVYTCLGMNAMSQMYHTLYQSRLAKGEWRDQVRPILINNWEATYFDFHEQKILDIANTAKSLGIEMFVLDDGWFGKRNDDTSSLGDWYPNKNKLPNGIKGLADKIEKIVLKFGLWFEPEMVNKNSELYRAHPEWVFETPGRESCHGRNQFILDFSNPEVVNYIYRSMVCILNDAAISYIKWDMNRCMSEVYSSTLASEHQGKVMHAYILGVYSLYERLTTKFPHILFESCASGGARFDPGMLYYAPQCWTSDNTDAVERLKIQYGTSYVYPISSLGTHVSAIPNHQMLREVPLETRANVAYFGTFGYELDVTTLSDKEKEEVKQQVQFMKQYREILQFGTFYRLLSPFEGNTTAWMIVSKDQNIAIVGYYRVLQLVNVGYTRLKLHGLCKDKEYHIDLLGLKCRGDELMNVGLITSDASSGENKEEYNGKNGDYQSRIYILKSV